jgi:DNA polymerase-3 subunit delta
MIPNLILLTGEDTFRMHERLRVLKKGFLQKYPNGELRVFETSQRGDGHDNFFALGKLNELVCTPNLFGEKRLAICEADWWNAEKFNVAERFFQLLKENADNSTVLVVQPKLDKRTKWSEFFLDNARKEEFEPLDESNLFRWIEQRAETLGTKISRTDTKFLVDRCGTDLWHIASELQKLATATSGETAISRELIEILSLPHPQLEIWGFLEKLSQRKTYDAITKFRSLLIMGTPVHQLFSMIQREIRIHAQLRAGIDQGLREGEIAQRMKLHPFVIKKTIDCTRNFSAAKIRTLYDQLFEIEKKMKSGGIIVTTSDTRPLEIAIEKFIIHCCS